MFTSNGSVSEPPCLTQIFLNDAFFNFTLRAYNCALNRIIAQPPGTVAGPGRRVSCSLSDFIFSKMTIFLRTVLRSFFYCCSIHIYVYIFLPSLYIFLPPLYSIYIFFVVVCCKV